jgi:hypothetical protein
VTAFYTDRTSAAPGERVQIHASSGSGPLVLEAIRCGAERRRVLRLEGLDCGEAPTPNDADVAGCGWPVVGAFEVGVDWPCGYYDLVLTPRAGTSARHFLCVTRGGRAPAKAVLVLATNTLHAYNYWGGRSAYADVGGLMSRRLSLEAAMAGAAGVLSAERPFAPMLLAPPEGMPRLVNLRKRGFEERPWAGADPAWSRAHGQSPYDGSAGFLDKWEHAFVRWAESRAGLDLDYLTDRDLETDPEALGPYRCVLLVGHSEYWSGPQRDALEAFVDQGGGLAILSGNTGFWKVRWELEGRRLVCRKWAGFDGADAAATVSPLEGTHLWSHPAFGRGEAALTGLSFLYGGYHRLGLCAARGQGGYAVHRHQHWALQDCDLYWGDVFGDQVPLIGYENDGCRFGFDEDNLPIPLPGADVPQNLEIIATAQAAFAESPSPYRALIPPEQLGVAAKIAYGADDARAQARMLRGHAVMASFRRGRGEVFNAGTTEWAHGLAAGDPFVETITRNVLRRFGAL